MIYVDVIQHVELECGRCGHTWQDEMTELATGYDHTFGYDEPEESECPNCGGEEAE